MKNLGSLRSSLRPSVSYKLDEFTELHNDEPIAVLVSEPDIDDLWLIDAYLAPFYVAIKKPTPLAQTLATISAIFLTYQISNFGPKLGPNLSQAIVMTCGSNIFPQLSAAVGIGAVAGMTSPETIINYGWLGLHSIVVSIAWLLASKFKFLPGFSGRLGTIAFPSLNFTLIIALWPAGDIDWQRYSVRHPENVYENLETGAVIGYFCGALLCALVSFTLRRRDGMENPIRAASLASLTIMVIVSATEWEYADNMMTGVSVGGYVGMGSLKYLSSLVRVAFAAFCAAGVVIILDPFFHGFGGKDGTMANLGFCFMMLTVFLIRKVCTLRDCVDPEDTLPAASVPARLHTHTELSFSGRLPSEISI